MSRGRFIVFEGGEGTGKSTQARLLADRLGAVCTHQPGGTELGRRIRALLLDDPGSGAAPLDDRAEALLMAADRAQHVTEVIEPALQAGRHVVCDRYIGSSIAYQGHGRGLDVDIVRAVSGWAAGGLWPDLVLLLEVPVDEARGRIGAARDRIEDAGTDFHTRVAAGFAAQADDEPDTWVVLDGTGSVQQVHERVMDAVVEVLGMDMEMSEGRP